MDYQNPPFAAIYHLLNPPAHVIVAKWRLHPIAEMAMGLS
jgi:hypothetical protein